MHARYACTVCMHGMYARYACAVILFMYYRRWTRKTMGGKVVYLIKVLETMRSLLARSNTISHRYACTVYVCGMHARYVCTVCMRGDTMHAPQDSDLDDDVPITETSKLSAPRVTASTMSFQHHQSPVCMHGMGVQHACTVCMRGMHAR
jgi:hypothetical protein